MLDQFYDPKWLVKITARDHSFASSLEKKEAERNLDYQHCSYGFYLVKLYTVRAEG